MENQFKKFLSEGKIDFFIDDSDLYRFTDYLDAKGIEYGETNITPNKTWVYDPDKWTDRLTRNLKNRIFPIRGNATQSSELYTHDHLDKIISEKIEEELDCKILDRVCAMLQTPYGKRKIHKSVRALIINQGMRDVDACLSHIENQLEGVN